MFDVKSWISPHIKDGQIHENKTPLCFKFVKDEHSGKALMFYRHWSHEDWMGPVKILSVSIYIMIKNPCLFNMFLQEDYFLFQSVPQATPKLVSPSSAKMDLESSMRDNLKFDRYLDNSAIEEWEQWMANTAVYDAKKISQRHGCLKN